ncbi:hypothetical protein [Sphingobacterium sp.]|uniref:hypothetical protein n=1 Tax=Sphingobacterium sp. TaxID=341027 RepID=UPI002896367E|nr:hypothetical protein [Sphingobacterium sp.]
MNPSTLEEEFGDLFAYSLSLDFQRKVSEIYYDECITETSNPIKKMIFENVVWQEFSEFDFVNIFNGIEIAYSFEEFVNGHLQYFNRMKNYITEDAMTAMKMQSLFYYTFLQTCGFNCFIITKTEVKIEFL